MTLFHSERLKDVDPRLVKLVTDYAAHVDVVVICGHRGESEQNACYENGTSKAKFPYSAHNKLPSIGVDISPTFDGGKTIPWRDLDKWVKFCEDFESYANRNGVRILGGHNFKFKDYPHWQLV